MAFYPTTVYDWPSSVLAEALDGNLHPLTKGPQDLTPKERLTVADRVTRSLGWENDRFLSSVADTVLNPWVMLMAASPLISEALPAAGQLFSKTMKSSAFVRKYPLVAQALKVLSPGQVLRGTSVEAAFMQADRTIGNLENELAARIAPVHDAFSRQHSLPQSIFTKNNPIAQEAADLLHVKLAGLDEARPVKTVLPNGEFKTSVVQPLVDRAVVDQRINELGLEPMVEAYRREFANAKQQLFGRDGLDHFEIDGAKVYKLHRNLKSEVFRGYSGSVMRGLVGEDLAEAAVAGQISKQDFLSEIASRFSDGLDEQHYMPRNQFVTVNSAGREVPSEVRISQREGRIISTTNASAPRTRITPLYAPDDLERLRRFATDQTEIDKQLQRAIDFPQEEMNRAAASGGKAPTQFRFDKIDFPAAVSKYLQDAHRSKAFFLDAPDEAVLASQRATLPMAEQAILDGKHKYQAVEDVPHFEDDLGFRHSALKPMDNEGPVGGWSIADAVWQGHQLVNDRVTQNTIADLYVPMALGQTGPRSALMLAVQKNMQAMAGVTAGILKNAGLDGTGLVSNLEKYAAQDVAEGKAAGMVGKASGYLYSTHIGFNLGTASMNAFQPFITTARFVELPHVLKGYAETLQRLGVYGAERAKLGKAFPTTSEKLGAMLKAIPEDMLEDAGIGPSALEAIDAVGFAGERMRQSGGWLQKTQDASLKLFEKTEWLNRLTTVAAQRSKQAAAGMDVLSPVARQEVRTLVNETQFGGHWLNTPEVFLDPKSPLSNNLLRQFLTFPLRMVTLTTNTAPHVASAGTDFIRGMGMSALVYEAGKHFLGPGIERGLYASTLLQMATQPSLPPALGIPKDTLTAIVGGDMELLRRQIPRLLPGGVAAARLIGTAPQMGGPIGFVQRQYVDWEQQTPDGRVPVYRRDGSLLKYDDPVALVAQGLGLPSPGANTQDLDKYLVKQRDQMVQYRREYLNRLANNDSAGAAGVANEFQTRFGFKLSVAQQQVREFKKIRGTPRTNRIFDRLPPEARPFYAESVANAGQMVGVPKETTLNAFQKLEAPQARFASEQPVPSPFGYPQDPSVGPQGFGGFDANPFKWTQPMGDVGGGA